MSATRKKVADLPIYESHSQCAARTGIPLAVIRQANKTEGCLAFRNGNRVDLHELLKFLFAEERDACQNWGFKLDEYRAKREEIRLQKDKAEVLDATEVGEALRQITAMMFAELDRNFLTELPPSLKGIDEQAIRAKCEAVISNLKSAMRTNFEKIVAEQKTAVETQPELIAEEKE